ncbi:23S rRNA (adenine(2503)-C(2))-methyltransferase RlmN [Phaeovibrio sulfidiphilus]|uniref:Dual-specificity RNA methyltransferase RlmN n=1 Tax=Phaeovibrio sulfidiphilus TaxID=1220600 RepID=A0A8J6YHW4_9PROT|nr:23S rRNA (adenine(2503)-C(2))-methyltransferase RlmN [Phaeovibrio sulfidiphilus]
MNLINLTKNEVKTFLTEQGESPFRAKQLWHWIYHQGATDFSRMTSLGAALRERLAETCTLARPEIVRTQTSEDGTVKWLLRFSDGREAEMVYIPETDRGALCISSQVGCTLDCRFCHTGTQPFLRNLTVAEIVGQFLVARDLFGEWPTPTDEARKLSNIVVMGMGEPLHNFDNVRDALNILMDDEGTALSRRRITLSTAGVVPMFGRCGTELGVRLAISLHAATDEIRDAIMPINKKYPLAELMAACRAYPGARNARRITFEYLLLDGINDSDADARELIRLVRGIPCKFNLLPFNAWPGAPYQPSSEARMERFAALLNDAGFTSPIRQPRGRDILAACGQLRSESMRESLREAGQTGETGTENAEGAGAGGATDATGPCGPAAS